MAGAKQSTAATGAARESWSGEGECGGVGGTVIGERGGAEAGSWGPKGSQGTAAAINGGGAIGAEKGGVARQARRAGAGEVSVHGNNSFVGTHHWRGGKELSRPGQRLVEAAVSRRASARVRARAGQRARRAFGQGGAAGSRVGDRGASLAAWCARRRPTIAGDQAEVLHQ
ncbi:spidroin-1-like [Setaria italica]|uniref:spidroin-1-like n=1 Tax=Setaria italica TaxID=4555 RepID=UPI0006464DE2|nr:spidroin-1-like [Setaria italica]